MVAILARPEGRALLKAELDQVKEMLLRSSPDPKAGRCAVLGRQTGGDRVAILARPEGRALPAG